jgi:sugar lactone lactonase YvrE
MSIRVMLGACGVAVGVCGLSGMASAQSELYISEYKYQDAQMSAVRTDGTSPRTMFSLSPSLWLPIGIAYRPSTGRLLWMDSAGASDVMSATTTGASQQTLATVPGFCKGVSLDAQGRIYFGSDNTVQRVNADGTGRVVLFTSVSPYPVGAPYVDATNGHVYFGDDGEIKRINLDGTNLKVVIHGISQARAIGLDIASSRIYWIDADTISDYIGRARLDDTQFTVLIDGSPSVVQSSGLIDFVVHPAGNAIYFADDLVDEVYKANLAGAGKQVIFASVSDRSPSGLSLDTGAITQSLHDVDHNGIADDVDIAGGAADCDNNGVPDRAQIKPCEQLNLLLDSGSNAAISNGHAIGSVSQWQMLQPFDVPGGGWDIDRIGLDGFTVNYHDGSGMDVALFPDDGSGQYPDETSAPIAATVMNFRFNINKVNWQYAPLKATLAPGRYWVRVVAHVPAVYQSSPNRGFTGLGAWARTGSGSYVSVPPMALRLIDDLACPADFNGDGFVNGNDYDEFASAFDVADLAADFNHDGFVNGDDYDAFAEHFDAGC